MTTPTLLGALAVLVACAAPDSRPDDAAVRLVVTPGPSYTVAVVAESAQAASGTYTLTVERSGASGTSRSSQSGAFTVSAGGRDTLSVSRVNASPGDALRAELVATWDGGGETRDVFEETIEARSGD